VSATALLSSFFTAQVDEADLPPYFTLGARAPRVGTAAMDSSDQSVLLLDEVTGVAACRSGLNVVGSDQVITRRSIGEIRYVTAVPTSPPEQALRAKLSLDQSLRLATGRRPYYSNLRNAPSMTPPRSIAAKVRVVEDFRELQVFANSLYAVPGMLMLADGRLNAQDFPGAPAIDLQARLLRARGIRYVGLAKTGLLAASVRREAVAIRRRVGNRPFAFGILERHLVQAYRESGQSTAAPKTIRHGSTTTALGGVGAFRFAVSLMGYELMIVEMSLYDFQAFGGLVRTGERLENLVHREIRDEGAVYSWDLLPLVTVSDWECHILPTLEEIVYSAYTDTELGLYPRALADIHNRIKLRYDEPELEWRRRGILVDLARQGIPLETIPIAPGGPHKTDPDEFNAWLTAR
jgi:hypothetical protein